LSTFGGRVQISLDKPKVISYWQSLPFKTGVTLNEVVFSKEEKHMTDICLMDSKHWGSRFLFLKVDLFHETSCPTEVTY
jgi:hypothetical protein